MTLAIQFQHLLAEDVKVIHPAAAYLCRPQDVMGQIKFPLKMVNDAQGPMGIVDKTGKAVVWFSDTYVPTKGYVWRPTDKPQQEPSLNGPRFYGPRGKVVRAIFELLRKGVA